MLYDDPNFIIKKDPIDDDVISLYAYIGKENVVQVPDGVTKICTYAFADNDRQNDTIKKIILSDSVNELDVYAFAYCRALKEIRWPENPDFSRLQLNPFTGCVSLERISFRRQSK